MGHPQSPGFSAAYKMGFGEACMPVIPGSGRRRCVDKRGGGRGLQDQWFSGSRSPLSTKYL